MMNCPLLRRALPLGLLVTVCASTAFAIPVKVSVNGKSGSATPDTIVVFDPLDASPASSRNTAIVDQINKTFVPKVTVIRTGTAVAFPNSDRIRHQVYSFSPTHPFTLKLYAGSPRTDIVFDKPGMVVLGCNIHDTMVGFIAVVDSPYFGKTSAAGVAELDLPAGRYRLRAWNPNMLAPVAPRQITVAAVPLEVTVQIDTDPARATDVEWPE